MSATVEVDQTDLKILKLLMRDVRMRLKDIAKDCGISSNSVLNRIKRLKTFGVITGATIWPRPDSLELPITATIGIDLDSNEDEVIKLISERMKLIEPSAALGKYDLLALVMAGSVTELDMMAYEVRKCAGVIKVTVNVWSDKPHMNFENVNLQPKETETGIVWESKSNLNFKNVNPQLEKSAGMDKLDYLILGELLKDSQLSFVTIAKKMDTSPYTIRKRYEKMKKEGVININSLLIDLEKLGYQGKVFLMITIAPQRDKSKTISAIKKIKNIFLVTEIMGSFDILALAPVTDINSIRTLVKETKKLPDVQKVEITCINNNDFPFNSSWRKLFSRKSHELATVSTK